MLLAIAAVCCAIVLSVAATCLSNAATASLRPRVAPASSPLRRAMSQAPCISASVNIGAGGGATGALPLALPPAGALPLAWAPPAPPPTPLWGASPKSLSKRNLRTTAISRSRALVDQLVFALLVGQHDLALAGELLGDGDHRQLGFLDVAQPDRTHRGHVFLEHRGCPLRHVGQEQVAQRFRRALEGQRQLVLLDIAQQRLHAARVQLAQVLEGEHEGADLLGGVAVALLQRGQEAGFRRAVEVVEDLGDHLVRV